MSGTGAINRERTILRGGHVITMDDETGDLPVGDVLIEGDTIAAIAPSIPVEDAVVVDARNTIVMPGLIDTHRHTWQTQMRGICADWTLNDYFLGMRLAISPAYTAEDVYIGNHLGAVDALRSGVTTILDFSHCNNTPQHADAAVAGLADAGIRALHCYGFFAPGGKSAAFPSHESRVADFARVVERYDRDGGLVRIGSAISEVATVPWSATVAEIDATRSLGARMVFHTGCQWGSVMTMGIREMHAHGLLGGDQVHVHCNTLDASEWAMLAGAQAKVSISPETELNMGMGRPMIAECRQHGIHPTLSCDIISLNSGDLFTQLRLALATARFGDNDAINRDGGMPETLAISSKEALRWATIYGAEACGLDSKVGSLRPGKQADVIVLGGPDSMAFRPYSDAAGSVVFQATAHEVRDVFVAGRCVKRGGSLVGVDVRSLLDRAEASAAGVMTKIRAGMPTFPPRANQRASYAAFETIAKKHLSEARAS